MSLEEKIKNVIAEVPDFPKAGISFKDITPVLQDAALCGEILVAMEKFAAPLQPDFIAGIESRGFLLGFALAQKMDIGFIPIRKKGKLPRAVFSEDYELEYGKATLEIHQDIPKGSRILIHDDLLGTGGTARAAFHLCEKVEAEVVGFSFLVELGFSSPREKLPEGAVVESLVGY